LLRTSRYPDVIALCSFWGKKKIFIYIWGCKEYEAVIVNTGEERHSQDKTAKNLITFCQTKFNL
jgi:hypothetical protein